MSFGSFVSGLFKSSSIPAIDHENFEKACKEGMCHVIDVREPHEFAMAHIPAAKNFPLSKFDASLLPKDLPVVLVCQAGSRSARALQQAHAVGRTDVVHYADGTSGWIGRGGSVER